MYNLKQQIIELCEHMDLSAEFVTSDDIYALRKRAESTFDLTLGLTFFNYDFPLGVTEPENPWIYRYLFELFSGRQAYLLLRQSAAPVNSGFVFQHGHELAGLLGVMPPFGFFATTADLDVAVLDGNHGYFSVFGERRDWVSSVKARVESLGFEWECAE